MITKIAVIILIGFISFYAIAFYQAKKEMKESRIKFFNKIKTHYPIIRINDNLYYFKGAYLSDSDFYLNNIKMKHYQNLNFTFNLLRIVKNT